MGLGVSSNLAEDLKPVNLGELQVEKDHLGPIQWIALSVRTSAEEKVEGFGAVVRDLDAIGELEFREGVQGELDIIRIVFNEQDLQAAVLVHDLCVCNAIGQQVVVDSPFYAM